MGRVAILRSRRRSWQVEATSVGMIVAAEAAIVAKRPHAWWWLVVVTVAATTAAPILLTVVPQAAQRRRVDAAEVRAGLQAPPVELEASYHLLRALGWRRECTRWSLSRRQSRCKSRGCRRSNGRLPTGDRFRHA